MKKKPVKLNIQVGLSDSGPSSGDAVKIEPGAAASARRASKSGQGKKGRSAPLKADPPGPGFDMRMRFEKKGRGGQPVYLIFSVDLNALHEKAGLSSLAELAARLKQSLSCGGSVLPPPENAVVLQCRDTDRLVKCLEKLGLKAQPSGGAQP